MRQTFLDLLYKQLAILLNKNNGYSYLNAQFPNALPKKGIYFFFENGIFRTNSTQLKVMRIGTHSTSKENGTTLRSRLNQHKGNLGNGGGNHRGSVFRLHVGNAHINDLGLHAAFPHWGLGNNAPAAIRAAELPHEITTSNTIRNYPYTFLSVPTFENRSFVETCSIELLSNSNVQIPIDAPLNNWLGFFSPNPAIVNSHLWNVQHINNYQAGNNERYETFINILTTLVDQH